MDFYLENEEVSHAYWYGYNPLYQIQAFQLRDISSVEKNLKAQEEFLNSLEDRDDRQYVTNFIGCYHDKEKSLYTVYFGNFDQDKIVPDLIKDYAQTLMKNEFFERIQKLTIIFNEIMKAGLTINDRMLFQ